MLKKIIQFWRLVFLQFYRDGCISRAASLAYITLLSLVPLLAVSFSFLTAFPVFKGLSQQIQNFIFTNFVAAAAQTVQQYFQSFIEQTANLSAWGLLVLLVAAVLLVFSIEQAFNSIWRVKRRRSDVSAFLIYWGVITFVPILVGIGLTLTSYLLTWPVILRAAAIAGVQKNVLLIAPYFLTYLVFAVLYIALPNRKVPISSALLAALPTTILFELAKLAFTIYIGNFSAYELIIYGALAIIPIFLIWLYVSWLIILFGAVMSYVLTTIRSSKSL